MRRLTPLLAVFLLLSLPSCTRGGSATEAAKRDFDRICKAQRDFLEARKMKGVDETQLGVERAKAMGEGLESEAALGAIQAIQATGPQERRMAVEKAAKEAGLGDWQCPELAAAP